MTEEKKDYGQTLNLPVTDFPMRGGLPTAEPKMQAWWTEIDIYNKVQQSRQGKPKFILHDGPPYANGDIHIGHALNKIIKDFIVRFKSMQGFDAPYVPGWDTHGLPIEQAIANSGKVDRKKMSVTEFREACKAYALTWVDKQKTQFERLGILGDFNHPYVTLDPIYEAQQIRLFGDMVNKGYIYKGLRPVYWSPSSESALAEAEIEYREKRSASIFVAFQVKDGKGVLPAGSEIVIWTTTPWTLPANLGISVNPEFDYAIVDVEGRTFVLAEGLLASVAEQVGWTTYQVVGKVKGQQLEFVTCAHPFYDRTSLVMVGDHVTLDAGTGCVHTAPGHGEDDFQIGKKYDLGVLCPVDDQGKFTQEAPGFEGIFYEDANKQIGQMLEASGHLLKLSFITHQYAHDWRTKKPVIYRATEQWFASIDGFRQAMLEEIKQVSWVPQWGEQRMHNMIAERGDWCISRQRTWGVPIPIFYCRSCNEPLVNEQTIEHVAGLFEQHGSNVWFDRAEEDLLPAGAVCTCGHHAFRKETDIMDVWFDSGSSHKSVLEARGELQFPADLYVEGFDQYRGWFNSSLITSTAVNGRAPYKQVISHGFALDGEGRKMSKSLGNTVDPTKVCNQLGADILRLWVASVDYGQDVRISDAILSQISEGYRKIRNTLRFFLGNLDGFNPASDLVAFEQMNELDRYAISGLHHLINKVTNAYDNYEFNVVYQSIHHYCAVDMSSFYLDITKDRLYASATNEQARKSAQTVLYHVLTALTRLIAPILPHTAEEVWKYMPYETLESVLLAYMPNASDYPVDAQLEQKWSAFTVVRDEIFKALEMARKDKVIGNSLGAHVDIYPTAAVKETLATFTQLEELLIVSSGTIHETDAVAPSEALELEGLKVLVTPAKGEKCERCWMVLPEVGEDATHPTLCKRCATVVSNA